eukprot:TRINITY_DN463_c0_g1_i4.p1 TRINITY_DN463_c0_g1~~TRINITY_DN463_c0_g1_i4.p1  ORF type:complete len:132 (+),score=21.12 TRINITY_DN463_c0_g1_i4:40-435(+)
MTAMTMRTASVLADCTGAMHTMKTMINDDEDGDEDLITTPQHTQRRYNHGMTAMMMLTASVLADYPGTIHTMTVKTVMKTLLLHHNNIPNEDTITDDCDDDAHSQRPRRLSRNDTHNDSEDGDEDLITTPQ